MIDNRFPFLVDTPPKWRRAAEEVSRRCMVRSCFNRLRGELFFFRRDPNIGVWAEEVVRPDGSFVTLENHSVDRICRSIQTAGGSLRDARRALEARQNRRDRHEQDQIERSVHRGTENGMRKVEDMRRHRTGIVVDGLKE